MKKRGKGENAGKRRRDGEDFPNEYRKNTASEQDEQGKGAIRRDATVKREKEKQSARPLIANRERPALPPFRMLPSASAFCLCPYNLNRLSLSLSPFGEERK